MVLGITSVPAKPAMACGYCRAEERRFLHHVRHRGIFRRLCTTCVLRLHTELFCPTCFDVYHPSPPPGNVVTCLKCYSLSHSHCVGPNPHSPYVCPICVNPSSPIFTVLKFSDNENYIVIDIMAGKILLAAATIASVSMNKAAMAARSEAEKRAKEAVVTREKARESLEQVLHLTAKEKMKKYHDTVSTSSVNNRVANSSSGAAVAERSQVVNMEKTDSSNEVLAALNLVELTEEEKLGLLNLQIVVSAQSSNNGVAMDVEVSRGTEVALISKTTEYSSAENHGAASKTERSGEVGQSDNQTAQGE